VKVLTEFGDHKEEKSSPVTLVDAYIPDTGDMVIPFMNNLRGRESTNQLINKNLVESADIPLPRLE